ncbi:unnamed protein product [Parnassius mnemosyne]|uniref:N-acetyltransferase domain-containing protein n=1 Tax=Parnassius mnemosyne TaxID=213953 RepID=A0AAV1LLS0_9NEOP
MSKNPHMPCRVWSRFQSRRPDGSILKLRIQNAPNDLLEEIIEFNVKYFCPDETFQKAAGIASNPEALAEYRRGFIHMAKNWFIVICCNDESPSVDKILGVCSVYLEKEKMSFQGNEFQTKEMQTLFKIIDEMNKFDKAVKNEFEYFHDGRGISVHPEYRGLGIAREFFKVRRFLINEQNIPMTCGWMTSYGSQKAAQNDNWETRAEVNVEEIEQNCGVIFKDNPTTFKFMIATANNGFK